MLDSNKDGRSPWISLVIIIALCTVGLIVFQFIGLSILIPITGDSIQQILNKIAYPSPYPNYKWAIIILQGLVSLGAFVVAPLYFIWKFEGKKFENYFHTRNFSANPAILTIILVFAFMMVNSIFIEWNMNFQFPDFMSGFGEWAKEKEDQLEQLTQYITTFDSLTYFVLVFLVVAALPGIGEELLFRGLIQNQILKISGNVHVAVWLAAIFFSAFHMQFFGFVPRLLLGAFFGYLYVFSGNLWYSILAHFANNGFTLIMLYLYQNRVTSYDIEDANSMPLMTVAVSFVIWSILFYLFYGQVKPEVKSTHE